MKTFRHIPIKLPEKMETQMIGGKRYYKTPEGNLCPSVTTVLSFMDEEGIARWTKKVGENLANHISTKARENGTGMHKIIEDYLDNLDVTGYKNGNLMPYAHFENIREYIDKIDDIWGHEAGLYSDSLRLAGTADCIAKYDGVPSIIDFKTASKRKQEDWIKKYFLQATAYREMFHELTGIKVDQIVVLISGEDGSKDIFIKNPDEYKTELMNILAKREAIQE